MSYLCFFALASAHCSVTIIKVSIASSSTSSPYLLSRSPCPFFVSCRVKRSKKVWSGTTVSCRRWGPVLSWFCWTSLHPANLSRLSIVIFCCSCGWSSRISRHLIKESRLLICKYFGYCVFLIGYIVFLRVVFVGDIWSVVYLVSI